MCPDKKSKQIQNGKTAGPDGDDSDETEKCKGLLEKAGILETGLYLAVGFSFSENQNQHDNRRKRDLTQYRAKRQTHVQSSETESSIVIKHTSFSGMVQQALPNQGAVTVRAQHDFKISLINCTFTRNERAVNIDVLEGGGGSIIVRFSKFIFNKAWGPGGAIHLYQISGHTNIDIKDTKFINNTALGLTDKLAQMIEQSAGNGTTVELSKISGSGGAIALNVKERINAGTCNAEIQNCKFKGNTAENYGGTMYITSGVTTKLFDNEFLNVAGKYNTTNRPTIGDIIESTGNIIMRHSNFTVATAQSDIAIFYYRADKDNAFLQTDEVQFVCPKGYQPDKVMSTVKSQSKNHPIETLMLYCRACSQGRYSLEFAKIRLTKERIVHEENRTCKGM